jgi:hypothetical protein
MDFHRSRTIRETRKEHRCYGCLEMIPKGSQAQHDTGRIGGDFYSSYLCSLCVEYVSKYDDYKDPLDGGYFEGHIGIARREREEAEHGLSSTDM